MALYAAFGVSGEERQKAAVTITAKATNLNRHGARVQLNRELQVGSVVKVKNQRGTQVSARIVAGTNLFIDGSPYSYLNYSEPMSTGRRIAREIKNALLTNNLRLVLDDTSVL